MKPVYTLISEHSSTYDLLFKANRRSKFEISPTFQDDVIVCVATLRNDGKQIKVGILAWCILLRLHYTGCSPIGSSSAQ